MRRTGSDWSHSESYRHVFLRERIVMKQKKNENQDGSIDEDSLFKGSVIT